jgi:arabinoxylan arabinofuranohydrolase
MGKSIFLVVLLLVLSCGFQVIAQQSKTSTPPKYNVPPADTLSAVAPQLITPGYLFNSDPTCREINGRFYIFTTHDPVTEKFQGPEDNWHSMMDFRALSTTDFKNWVDHGSIVSIFDLPWAEDYALWDGDAGVPANGKFYAYLPVGIENFKIGVLVADNPLGPYTDPIGKPLITTDTLRKRNLVPRKTACLSPTVIYSEDGKPYLLFGQYNVYLAELKPNMIELAGPVIEVSVPMKSGEAMEYFEGPWINKMNGKYYFSYMTKKDFGGKNPTFADTDPDGPYIRYCISDNLFGPYKDPRNWFYPYPRASNNQHAIGTYKGEKYVVYHIPFQGKQHRQVAVTKVNILKDGSLEPIYPDKDKGIVPQKSMSLTLDAYAWKREAEEFYQRFDAIEERGLKQDWHFKMKDGGYLRFRNMDFGSGAKGFKINVSCENSRIKNAKVEFHIDYPEGAKIGECVVKRSTWDVVTSYKTIVGDVSEVKGVHDVYIVAHGENGDAYGRLFNINWFTFTRPDKP